MEFYFGANKTIHVLVGSGFIENIIHQYFTKIKMKFPQDSPECLGNHRSIDFLKNDRWLADTEVIPNIKKEKGQWVIYLVFVHVRTRFRLLRRKISVCRSQSQAEITAKMYQRMAAKDPRGTLKAKQDDFNICLN